MRKKTKTKKPTTKQIKERLARVEAMIEDKSSYMATFSSDEERLTFTLGMIEGIRWTSGIKIKKKLDRK